MPTLVDAALVVVVMVLVLRRQMRPRLLDTDRRFWLLPLVLAVVALRDPQLIDRRDTVWSVVLLGCGTVAVLAAGSVWGWTVRLWRDADGALWSRGTRATLAAWGGTVAVRAGLFGLGAALHLRQSSSALLLSLAVLLLVRSLVVHWRARSLLPLGRVTLTS
ncbi:DUF1453 domain-containing protein [Kitasatospora purpeofusca]|uniref:DUF1453 domain-containing protein n=1 Tax=Kitasatospora purpeofusca TaxID=67352 RepID=UPI0022555170|nr:DUF1453 domain-containing protein [Kitasatospora purpeofusca]MCX4757686.1 DUF1453 domain-containing protein [Kitasatospora purpeofusca]WSR34605.1 DUF1453 domain-containing protein [Kitasatospora purpeofusca]